MDLSTMNAKQIDMTDQGGRTRRQTVPTSTEFDELVVVLILLGLRVYDDDLTKAKDMYNMYIYNMYRYIYIFICK